jgi:hypothetical protein
MEKSDWAGRLFLIQEVQKWKHHSEIERRRTVTWPNLFAVAMTKGTVDLTGLDRQNEDVEGFVTVV